MPQINPYNFVPLPETSSTQARNISYSGHDRIGKDHYSGVLKGTLKALSPLISIDQREKTEWTGEFQNERGEKCNLKVFKFLKSSDGRPMLQGASVKGMIRAIYETMTDSCLALANVEKHDDKPYSYMLGQFDRKFCNKIDNLCPACRLFGKIEGNILHSQGKVSFSDAVLAKGSLIVCNPPLYLKELSKPKPYHSPTYGQGGVKESIIAGRKFYYHQGINPNYSVPERSASPRAIAISEYAPVNCEFAFKIFIQNLSKDELSMLLLAIELHEGLGHKIGLGKAIGLGSCTLTIDKPSSAVFCSGDRYKSLKQAPDQSWHGIKAVKSKLLPALIELLRLNKYRDEGIIGYPGRPYPSNRIDALGVFGGNATKGGRPDWPLTVTSTKPTTDPPALKKDQEAAWLKAIYKEQLVFIDVEGDQKIRARSGYQGKKEYLKVGEWFILSGEKRSEPALKK